MEYFGTEKVGSRPAKTENQRAGRCFELAGYALSLGTAPRDALLVHGSIHGIRALKRIDHAWLLIPGEKKIWEPMQARLWDDDMWHLMARPVINHSYTVQDVYNWMIESENWGPWE